jgi:hypothetical protein
MTLKQEREARIAAKAAAKAEKAAAEKARIESNPIYAAIAPQRAGAIEAAQKFTRERLLKLAAQFHAGADFKVLAPPPNSFKDGRGQYQLKQAFRSLAQRIILVQRGPWPKYDETVLGVNEEGIERLVEEAGTEAAASFDAYVAKLTSKVGQCDSAVVMGNLWSNSVLTVWKAGKVEAWKTQQILNFSVYGKAFNQWPTRQIGSKEAAA